MHNVGLDLQETIVPIEVSRLATDLDPTKTLLFFGAGAALSSHAPSVARLLRHFEDAFKMSAAGYSLREFAGILENQFGRARLINELMVPFAHLKPTGSLLNLPLYKWKAIYSTNYDTLVEQCYKIKNVELSVIESNFDFGASNSPDSVKLFKLHGSIGKDIALGHSSRMIITDSDYDHTHSYREGLFDRFKSDFFGAHLVIIGHSLADEDIKAVANRAAELSARDGNSGRVTLMMFEEDANRAQLWERRGFQVCFGGLDQFFSALASKLPSSTLYFKTAEVPFDHAPGLRPTTIDVSHAVTAESNVSNMFNGWPASYADIAANLTFARILQTPVIDFLDGPSAISAIILGASGLGKTTAARQILLAMHAKGYFCWEHKLDFDLSVNSWVAVAKSLSTFGRRGILFVDEAHLQLYQLNELIDALYTNKIFDLKIVLVSTRNHWNPRVKAAGFYKAGKEFRLPKLQSSEIEGLLNLVDSTPQIRALVEESFSGFSRYEKRRRLIDRCEAETFVCLKNVFSSEKFDDIILREYAALAQEHQEVYRIVAAMEASGIRVHRQLVMRLLNVPATHIGAVLSYLTDIVQEYTINEREGIYGWRGRHAVIVGILTKYKYSDTGALTALFESVIEAISPTYEIEIRTIRELCNIDTGLPRIPDRSVQNRLLRKMMSIAPGERVPRHRLIRNLIEMGEFEKADSEIRIFENDFGRDAPVSRYKVHVLVGRALNTEGILEEDRVVILQQAADMAAAAAHKHRDNKWVLTTYCEVGVQIFKRTGSFATLDLAMAELKAAEARVEDPDISKIVHRFERVMAGFACEEVTSPADDEMETE